MTSFDPPVVALLGDVIAVLLVRDGGLSGDVLLYDLDGAYLRTASIFAHRARPIWVGGDIDALWMALQPTPTADIELGHYSLDADRFVRSGPTAIVGPTSLDDRRLHVDPESGVLGNDGLPLMSQGGPSIGAHSSIVPWAAGSVASVQRTETYGATHSWDVRTAIDAASPPTQTILAVPYGDGVVLHGSTSASGDGFLAWLQPDGDPIIWGRLGDWTYADANTSTVIVTRVTDTGLELGIARSS
jgi:hypothetical protein